MYIGIRGHDFDTDTISDLSKKCAEYSIEYIQLALKKSIRGFQEGKYTPEYAAEIGKILRMNGVKVSVLGCYINPSGTNEEKLKKELN